ncbi:hypothetical protein IscW_ISCW011801 [Ixodes scapularis]|uniref:Mediator of RNA polymerase II transcription subunit 14 n=1 Tax=Ixodes scapularis TaxID=6945 RepID=B7Q4A1_IXOSC|nr:hypothetical protein IscW_ISCW011801 [Ixodes scapularis]|eukprot:XP_002411504.1 hypothetical protein IscW_ISCW011801 [Ixodes scapularis]
MAKLLAAIVGFLDKQNLLFVETADILAMMARETLVQARLPSFHIPCAVEVLTLGTYSRLPTCIRVSLTLMGDGPHIPWRLLDIDILVEDKDTGDCRALVHSLQIQFIHQLIQSRLVDNPKPLHELYNCLRILAGTPLAYLQDFAASDSEISSASMNIVQGKIWLCSTGDDEFILMRLRHLHCQATLIGGLGAVVLRDSSRLYHVVEGSSLFARRDQFSKEKQTYQLNIQVDSVDPRKPLRVTHNPALPHKDAVWADQAIKSEFLSVEKLLIQTIHIRTKQRLSDLRDRLRSSVVGPAECPILGSPAMLQVPLLQPCMQSENLLVTVDTHTGYFLAFVPQYDPPMIGEIQEALNKDAAKLDTLLTDLRFWMTVKRCEKTLQHLPVLTSPKLPLVVPRGHPATRLGPHTLYVKLCKHHNCYVVSQDV